MDINAKKEIACSVNMDVGVTIRRMHMPNDGFKSFDLHWHDYMELIYMLEGTLFLNFGNEEMTAKTGDLIIFAPGQLHEGRPGPDSAKIYSIFLDLNALTNSTFASKAFLEPILEQKVCFSYITTESEIINTAKELIAAYNVRNSIYTQGKTFELIGLLLEQSSFTNPKSISTKMKKIFEYIQAHFSDDISVNTICREFGYTESHLCRLFKSYTGLTISLYIRTVRIENAKKMLQETNTDINKISEICGFFDFSYFSRCFKKHVGETPSQFRSSMKKKHLL